MVLAAATRYYPGLEFLLMQFVPASIRKMQEDHYATALEKIHRRMRLETQRDDFMTPIIESNLDYEKMSLSEIESTMALLLIAGSETTGTTLCGITNYLVQNPLELEKLEREVRSNFKKESEITFRAIQHLPFLNAVIHEGLRLCNPVAGGMPRIVPEGGDTVSGYFLPGGVSIVDLQHQGMLIQFSMLDPYYGESDGSVPLRSQLPPSGGVSAQSLPTRQPSTCGIHE